MTRRRWIRAFPQSLVALAIVSCSTEPPGGESRAVGSEVAVERPAEPAPTVVGVPEEIFDPPWLEERRARQLATADGIEAFHDFRFRDRAPESGITFVNRTTEDSGKAYKAVHYDHGTALAVADVDGDLLPDLYFANQVGGNELWRNLGGGQFEDVTSRAGVAVADAISAGASFADIDDDGDADLYVTTVRGGNRLFLNDGTGRFADGTAASNLGYVGHSSAAVFFDYDRDGRLDLFLCNVGVYTTDRVGPGGYFVGVGDAFAGHLKPEERNETSRLFHNEGGGVFRDVTVETGLVDESWTGDAAVFDADLDGWPDLYVLNMQGHDQFWRNVGGRTFERKSRELFPRTSWGAMGIQIFDFDNDRDLDLFITDMHSDMSKNVGPWEEKEKSDMQWPETLLQSGGQSVFGNTFFRNDGGGRFEEVSDELGTENYWPWGLSVGDLNADGWLDVFVTASMNFGFRYGVNSLLLNEQGTRFVDSEFILGVEPRRDRRTARPWFELDCLGADQESPECFERGLLGPAVLWGATGSRSSAMFDLDADGDLDIVTNEFHDGPMVLVSDLSERRDLRYVQVRLVGTTSNRDGLGARVTVEAGGRSFLRVHDGKSGYLSQSSLPLYFGLGDAPVADRVHVVWPSGTEQTVPGPLPSGETIEVREPPEAGG